jgi:drug/metabolite transporter (DMT)-like permease
MHKRLFRPTHSGTGVGLAAIAAAALLWAAGGVVASDLFDAGITPAELTEARVVVAAAGLLLLPAARRRPESPGLRPLAGLALSLAFVTATYYLAIERLEVAVAIVLQYTAPVLVVLWVALGARRRLLPNVWLASAGAFLGVVLVSELLLGEVGRVDSLGIVFGLASAVLFASYTLFSERAGEIYGAPGAMLRAFALAALIWVAYQVPNGWPVELLDGGNLIPVLFVGVGGTLAPFLLFVWAVQRVRPERAAVVATLEPLFAAVIAWAWLGQTLSAMQVAGGLLILGSVLWLQLSTREPVVAPEL